MDNDELNAVIDDIITNKKDQKDQKDQKDNERGRGKMSSGIRISPRGNGNGDKYPPVKNSPTQNSPHHPPAAPVSPAGRDTGGIGDSISSLPNINVIGSDKGISGRYVRMYVCVDGWSLKGLFSIWLI